jgi:hypothetical protein
MTIDRSAYTSGLRLLADILDDHPEVPLPYDGRVAPITIHHLYASEAGRTIREEFQATIRAFPGTKTKNASDGGSYFDVDLDLHGLKVQISTLRDEVCERVVTGTREVTREVPDPQALAAVPTVTVKETVEDVRWECRPLLAEQQS